jgi:glycosyltransferase involved in cell wall biosynthesis
MTTNDDMTPRQPGEDEPLEQLFSGVFDLVDKTVARITDAEVNEHLRMVLSDSGYTSAEQLTGLWQPLRSESETFADLNCSMDAAITPKQGSIADLMAIAQANAKVSGERLRQAQEALEAARQQAEQIVAAARDEADKALKQAAQMIRDAREQSERIISDARREAKQSILAVEDNQANLTGPRRIRVYDLEGDSELTCAPDQFAQNVFWRSEVSLAGCSSQKESSASAIMTRTQETVVDSPTHSQEDHTQIRPPGGNPIPERCSSSGGPAQGDSAYARAGSPSDLPTLLASLEPWPKVSVVIPTLNEARNLPHVFAKLPDGLHEVIIVDGHSVDDTVATARKLRPDVRIVSQNRSGKGNALACGFEEVTGDIIVMVDADGSADPAEIPQFIKALLDGADFAKGTRFADGGGSCDITRLRSLGNRMLSGLVNTLCRTKYSDLCYGYNAFWRHFVPVFGLDVETDVPVDGGTKLWGDGFEVETLINIRIAQADLKVTEVPSYEHSRIHGVSNFSAARDGWRVLRTILTERYYYHNRRKAQRKLAAGLAAMAPAHCQDTGIPESAR